MIKEMRGYIKFLVAGMVLIIGSNFALAFTSPGSRALSMGGAFTAVADDISCVFWNPAGLSRIKNLRTGSSLSITIKNRESWEKFYQIAKAFQKEEYAEVLNLFKEVEAPFGSAPTLTLEGFVTSRLALTTIPQTEIEVSKFNYDEKTFSIEIEDKETLLIPLYLTVATELPQSFFWVGGNLKYFFKGFKHYSHFQFLLPTGQLQEIDPEQTGDAEPIFSGDIGLLYELKGTGLTIGMEVKDIFEPGIKFENFEEELILSRKINVGLSYRPTPQVILSVDVHNLFKEERTFHLGTEINFYLVKLRAGLNAGTFCWGLGIDVGFFNLDFAYSEEKENNPIVSIDFGVNI